MSVTDKMWDAITKVIRMDDKVERLAGTVKDQQAKIENLTERVIRLETALEIALAGKGINVSSTKQIK
ncbi:MAG: hypothetical protein ACYC9J_11735 [Sulfuricaulis sp.]